MRSVRLAAFAALSSLALSPSLAQARSCWLPEEAEAAQVRGLHLMLMAGTLQCRAAYPRSVDYYNDFVEQQRGVLVDNVEILKGHFMRESGDRWQKDSDAFETSLSNLYSARLDDGGYCDMVHNYARMAADSSRGDLLLLAESVADAPVSGICRRPDAFAAAEGSYDRPTRRLPPKVALSDALRAPAPPVEPVRTVEVEPAVVVAAVEPVPAPVEAEAPTPQVVEAAVEVAAVEPAQAEAIAAPAPSKDDALKAAVAALQSAVVALQAVSAPEGVDAKGQ